MNRRLFLLVSYFVCFLFFTLQTHAATFSVTSTTNDPSAVNGLGWAITQANGAGAGPHTILLTVDGATWGVGVTLTNSNVTIMAAPSGCDATRVINMGGANLTVAGNNCVISGIIFRGTCLLITGSNNRVWGCWFNTDATGLASQGVGTNNGSMIYINGGANNTVGMTGQCRNVFSGASTTDMIRVDGTATGTIISNNYMGVGKNGITTLSAASQNGINFVSGSMANSRIDSNVIALTNADAIKIAGTYTSSFIRRNTISQASGANANAILVSGDFSSGLIAYNTITNVAGSGVLISGGATGLTIDNNDISNAVNNGIKIEGAVTLNTLTVTNNKIRSITTLADRTDEADGFGIKLRSFTSNNVLVQGNLIGVQADGTASATELGCSKNGIYARANIAALTINDNVVCDNGNAQSGREICSGLFITANGETFGSIAVTNNYVGVDKSGNKKGNDFAGINLRYVSGTIGSVNISTNYVGDNGANAGPNPQNPNYLRRSHGIAIQGYYASSAANFRVNGNFVGAFPSGGSFLDVGNHANGIELYDCRNFFVGQSGSGNVVGFNKFETIETGFTGAGIMINGASSNGTLQGNFIGVGSAGQNIGNINPTNANATLANTNSGITIEQSSGISILSNTIRNNNYGIQIAKVGASFSSGNTITGNTVSNNTVHGIIVSGGNTNTFTTNTVASNGTYGIYIPGGSGNTIGDATNAANGNTVTLNGSDGIQVTNATSINNRITRNQISCNSGQGIKLNYGASAGNNGQLPPVITAKTGNTISGTATAGATIEIFADAPACAMACGTSGSAKREGRTYITTVTAAGGVWSYTGSEVLTDSISATATVGSNTSEFSYCNILTICPTAAAGSNQTLACDVTSTTLAATAAGTGETGTWTVVPANPAIIFSNVNAHNSTVSNLPTGTTTLRWTISKSGCPDDFKDITITVRVSVAATASVNTTSVCSTNATVNLTGSNPSPGTGLWTVVGGAATLTNATSFNTATATITTSPATFRWTITNGTCTSFANTSAVTVTTGVTATASVNTTSVCSSSPGVTLTGNNPSPGTGLWTVTSGAATISVATDFSTTATITTSPATFTWTTTNGPCISTANTSAVTVTNAVTATASVNTTSVCSTNTTVNLTGNNPSPGTGLWTVVGGAATLTNATSFNTATATITTSPATFRWTTTNGPCSSFANTSAVTVTNAVTATASVNTTSVCSSSPGVTLTGNNPSPGTGLWTVTGGAATLTNATSYNTATASITSGPATFTWTTTNGPCTSSANTSAVTVSTPVSPSATATSNVCSTSPLVVLTGNTVNSPATGQWTVTGGTATFGNASNASTTATITSGTSLTFTWTTTNGACTTFANATTTVSSPVTATASSNVNAVCTSNPVVTLTGSNPSPGTGLWTVSGGTATFVNATSASTNATITSGTSLTFTWTITNGACSTAASTNIITVSNPVNPVTASATSNVCSSSPVVSLTGSNPSPGTGLWTVTGGTATFVNAAQESTSATVTSGTSLTFTWTVTNGPCVTAATATTTVNAAVTADAGPAQALCNTPTTSLAANNPSPGTGAWSVTNGTASVTTPSSPTSGVTGLTIGGSSTLLWTVTNGACSATSSVTITVSAPGSTSAGPDQSVCQTNMGTVTLVGTGTGTWSTISGSGVASSPNSASTGVTGLTVGATSSFRWSVTSGACSGADTVNVTVSATPVGSAGGDQALCNQTTATLSGTGSGAWTTVSGTGVVSNPTVGNSGVTGLTVGGSTTLRWTLTNGACVVPLDVIVTSSSPVTANGGSDVEVCNGTTANLSATGTGAWTATATMGTGTVTSPSSASTGVTGLTIGSSSTFEWIVTSGACADTNLVTVTSYSPATASAGSDRSLCNTTTYTMTATGTGLWSVLTGTGALTTPASPTSGVTGLTIGGSSVFVWTVSNGTCSATDSVTLTVSPGTTADAGSNQTLCNETTTTLDAVDGTNGTWLASTDATIADLSDPNSSVTVINSPATLTWQIDGGGCGTASAQVTITAVTLDKPILDGTGLSQACSGSTYTYSIDNIDAAGTYTWSSNPASGITINPLTATSVDVSATSSGKLIVFVNKSGCADSASAVITVLPGNPADADTVRLATCLLTNYVIETPIIDGFPLGTWTSDGGTLTFTYNPADSTTTIGPITDNWSDTLVYTVTNACGSTRYPFILKIGGVFQSLEASGPSDTLCVSKARNLNALVNPAGNYTYYWVSNVNYNNPVIDANVHIDSTTVPTYSVTPTGPNNVYFVYVVDKASQCKTDIDTAYIHAVEGQDLNVPNLITPNEDNMNDYWVLRDKVTGKDILPGSQFDLYNRWGQRVFTMSDYDNRFNANHISDGIYYFNVKSGCGDKEYKGWLQILGNTNP